MELRQLVAGVVSIGITAAALAGCGGGHSRSGATGATVPPGPTATTVDVAHVPATIDATYVQHVMDALDQVLGDALREFAANRGPTKLFDDLLTAIYTSPQYDKEVSTYGRVAVTGPLILLTMRKPLLSLRIIPIRRIRGRCRGSPQ